MPEAIMIYSSWENTTGVSAKCALAHLAKLAIVASCVLRYNLLLHPRKQKVKSGDWISEIKSPASFGPKQ